MTAPPGVPLLYLEPPPCLIPGFPAPAPIVSHLGFVLRVRQKNLRRAFLG
jgi:hypothetical protein